MESSGVKKIVIRAKKLRYNMNIKIILNNKEESVWYFKRWFAKNPAIADQKKQNVYRENYE